jgi:hypothetical protein
MYSKNEGKQFDLMGDAAEFAMDHGTSKKNKKRSGRPLLLFLLLDPPAALGLAGQEPCILIWGYWI